MILLFGIEYFKHGTINNLDDLIEEDLVCTNQVILTEILPNLKRSGYNDLVESLSILKDIPLNIDWEIIRRYRLMNIEHGVNKVGIPDLIILQQVIEHKLTLFSLDKHFRLMKDFLYFELFD